jgi:hypothetical protein
MTAKKHQRGDNSDGNVDTILKIFLPFLVALFSAWLGLLVSKDVPSTLKVVGGVEVFAFVYGIILVITKKKGPWESVAEYIGIPLVFLTGLGYAFWWSSSNDIPSDVTARRKLVHEIQAEVELPSVCGKVSEYGGKKWKEWYRRPNAIDYELIYAEGLDEDGHNVRLYLYKNKTVAMEELRAQRDYVQGYYEGGPAFAYDLLDHDRRPKELIYKRQSPSHRFAPSTTVFWGNPEPFRATSPDFHPCQGPPTGITEAPSIPATLAVLPPAIGYR